MFIRIKRTLAKGEIFISVGSAVLLPKERAAKIGRNIK
jgi:hypothetical protein